MSIYSYYRYIFATMPPEDEILYYHVVNDQMIHVCSKAENGCIDSNGNCRRGYKNRVLLQASTLDENGYPKYKRPTERDFNVVPHNRDLLLDWEGHINVDYAGTSNTVLYLCKYLFKGNRKVKAIFKDITENISKTTKSNFMFVEDLCALWMQCGESVDIIFIPLRCRRYQR